KDYTLNFIFQNAIAPLFENQLEQLGHSLSACVTDFFDVGTVGLAYWKLRPQIPLTIVKRAFVEALDLLTETNFKSGQQITKEAMRKSYTQYTEREMLLSPFLWTKHFDTNHYENNVCTDANRFKWNDF